MKFFNRKLKSGFDSRQRSFDSNNAEGSFIQNINLMDSSKRNVERIIDKWANTGSATKRVDGVYFSYKANAKVELGIVSGLNCVSRKTRSPLHIQMKTNKGDDGATIDEI